MANYKDLTKTQLNVVNRHLSSHKRLPCIDARSYSDATPSLVIHSDLFSTDVGSKVTITDVEGMDPFDTLTVLGLKNGESLFTGTIIGYVDFNRVYWSVEEGAVCIELRLVPVVDFGKGWDNNKLYIPVCSQSLTYFSADGKVVKPRIKTNHRNTRHGFIGLHHPPRQRMLMATKEGDVPVYLYSVQFNRMLRNGWDAKEIYNVQMEDESGHTLVTEFNRLKPIEETVRKETLQEEQAGNRGWILDALERKFAHHTPNEFQQYRQQGAIMQIDHAAPTPFTETVLKTKNYDMYLREIDSIIKTHYPEGMTKDRGDWIDDNAHKLDTLRQMVRILHTQPLKQEVMLAVEIAGGTTSYHFATAQGGPVQGFRDYNNPNPAPMAPTTLTFTLSIIFVALEEAKAEVPESNPVAE